MNHLNDVTSVWKMSNAITDKHTLSHTHTHTLTPPHTHINIPPPPISIHTHSHKLTPPLQHTHTHPGNWPAHSWWRCPPWLCPRWPPCASIALSLPGPQSETWPSAFQTLCPRTEWSLCPSHRPVPDSANFQSHGENVTHVHYNKAQAPCKSAVGWRSHRPLISRCLHTTSRSTKR